MTLSPSEAIDKESDVPINNLSYITENNPGSLGNHRNVEESWEISNIQTPSSSGLCSGNLDAQSDLMDTCCASDSDTAFSFSVNSVFSGTPINILPVGRKHLLLDDKIEASSGCRRKILKRFKRFLRHIKEFSSALTLYIIYHISILNIYPAIYSAHKDMNTGNIYEYYYVRHIIPNGLTSSIMDSCYLACLVYIFAYFTGKYIRRTCSNIKSTPNFNEISVIVSTVLMRIFGISLLIVIFIGLSQYIAHESLNSKGLFVPDIWFSLAKDKYKYDDFKGWDCIFCHWILYLFGIIVDFYGFVISLKMIFLYVHWFDFTALVTYLTILINTGLPLMREGMLGPYNSCNGNDHHWYKFNTKDIMHIKSSSGTMHFGDFRASASSSYPPLFYSDYILMRDGIKIAIDVYLPRNYFKYKSLPTVVDITRYNRRMNIHWPFTLFSLWGEPRSVSMNIWSWQITQTFIPNNYVVVVLDTRGTGASTGYRVVDFSKKEVDDFPKIIEWIKKQPWSNGKVGIGGISYDGMAALKTASSTLDILGDDDKGLSSISMNLTNNSQALVDAVFALYSPMNVITELVEPGGVICKSFVEDYSSLTHSFEQYGSPLWHFLKSVSYYPFKLILAFVLVLGNVSPVQGYAHTKRQALEIHKKNWDMSKTIKKYRHIDEPVMLDDGTFISAESFGNTVETAHILGKRGVSVYLTTGYCDSANTRGVLQFYDALIDSSLKFSNVNYGGNDTIIDKKPIYKLVMGPWTHSGRSNCSPYGKQKSCFEASLYYDLVRFMDCILKGICWSQDDDNIHYFQIGEEKWYSTNKFPPDDTKYIHLGIDQSSSIVDNNKLFNSKARKTNIVPLSDILSNYLEQKRANSSRYIQLKVNDNYISEHRSRWMIALHPFRVTVTYNKKGKQIWHAGERLHSKNNNQHIRFITKPFKTALKLAGSVWLTFSVQLLDGYDAPIYVYLEDIFPDGTIKYVTEGLAQIGHRHVEMPKDILNNIPDGSPIKVVRPLIKDYYRPLEKVGDTVDVQITLEPIAWTFFKDHKLAISITGADKNNFKIHHISQKLQIAKTLNIKLDDSFSIKIPIQR
ncbi:X-Pro dipeptidyl-peptidase S15 family protein [Cryptosporidium serpentis]